MCYGTAQPARNATNVHSSMKLPVLFLGFLFPCQLIKMLFIIRIRSSILLFWPLYVRRLHYKKSIPVVSAFTMVFFDVCVCVCVCGVRCTPQVIHTYFIAFCFATSHANFIRSTNNSIEKSKEYTENIRLK